MATCWTEMAACKGMTNLFIPPTTTRGKTKQAMERKAKRICASCPVLQRCAEEHLEARVYDTIPLVGIWGGMNPLERDWIQRNRQAADALSQQLRKANINPQDLRVWMDSCGPVGGPNPDMSIPAAAALWGYSYSSVRRWYHQSNVKPKPHFLVWADAIHMLVSSEPEKWWTHNELISKMGGLIPIAMIEEMQKKSTKSTQAVIHRIVYRVVNSRVRRGHYEKRLTGGRLQVRMAVSHRNVEPVTADVEATETGIAEAG